MQRSLDYLYSPLAKEQAGERVVGEHNVVPGDQHVYLPSPQGVDIDVGHRDYEDAARINFTVRVKRVLDHGYPLASRKRVPRLVALLRAPDHYDEAVPAASAFAAIPTTATAYVFEGKLYSR